MAQAQDAVSAQSREAKRVKTEHGVTDVLASTMADAGLGSSANANSTAINPGQQAWYALSKPPSNGSSFANTPDAMLPHTPLNGNNPSHTTGSHIPPNESAAQGPSGSRLFSSSGRKDEATNEVDQLQDLLGMSGVDLRAEEEAIHSSGSTSYGYTANRPVHEPPSRSHEHYIEFLAMSQRVHKIAARNGLQVEPEVLVLLSHASKIRLHNLLQAMIAASRHRQWSSVARPALLDPLTNKPLYHEEIHDDPHKLLTALNRVEKAEEQAARQARLEREERDARLAAGQAENEARKDATGGGQEQGVTSGDGLGTDEAKRKGKKVGASAAARNMTEDKRLKLANNTAARALGINAGSKAWMFGAGTVPGAVAGSENAALLAGQGGVTRLPKPRFAPANSVESSGLNGQDGELSTSADRSTVNGEGANPGGWGDLAARQRRKVEEEKERKRRVNLDDALFALEMERKGGAGKGSGQGVLFATRALGRPTLPYVSFASR